SCSYLMLILFRLYAISFSIFLLSAYRFPLLTAKCNFNLQFLIFPPSAAQSLPTLSNFNLDFFAYRLPLFTAKCNFNLQFSILPPTAAQSLPTLSNFNLNYFAYRQTISITFSNWPIDKSSNQLLHQYISTF